MGLRAFTASRWLTIGAAAFVSSLQQIYKSFTKAELEAEICTGCEFFRLGSKVSSLGDTRICRCCKDLHDATRALDGRAGNVGLFTAIAVLVERIRPRQFDLSYHKTATRLGTLSVAYELSFVTAENFSRSSSLF